MTKETEFLETVITLVWNDISKQELIEMLKERKDALTEQLSIHGVVVNEAVCDCWDEHWAYDESGVDMYCTKCKESEVAFNCFGGNHAKGIKPCVEHCGDDICLKP